MTQQSLPIQKVFTLLKLHVNRKKLWYEIAFWILKEKKLCIRCPTKRAHELSLNKANIAIGRTVYLLQTKNPNLLGLFLYNNDLL